MDLRTMGTATLGAMALGGTPAAAQHAEAPAVTLPQTEVHTLFSTQIGADFEIWIARPIGGVMGLPDAPTGVLYVLDANLYFGTAVEMTRLMHQLFGELPPLLVVGIAYPTDDPLLQAELRARDFTPTRDDGIDQMLAALPGGRQPTLPEDQRLGGAHRFLSFLVDDVRPMVEARFDVQAGGSALWGASLGGLFTLYAMLEAPRSFDAFLATSPSIWWDDALILRMEAERSGRPELDTQVVLSVGAQEERADIPMLAQFKMISNVRSLAERLEASTHEGLKLSVHVLDGESHTSVGGPALARSLRDVYARRAPGR